MKGRIRLTLYKEREFNLAEKYNMKEILKKVDPFMLVEREYNLAEKYNMIQGYWGADFKFLYGPSENTKCIEAYFGTAESFTSGSQISSRSLHRPVKTTESVSIGLNLIRAEGTKSSSSSVMAVSPAAGKWGITLRFTTTGCNSSNSKLGSFSAEPTNWFIQKKKRKERAELTTSI